MERKGTRRPIIGGKNSLESKRLYQFEKITFFIAEAKLVFIITQSFSRLHAWLAFLLL